MSYEEWFQSALPVWGATAALFQARPYRSVSIRAPRVGSDRIHRGAPQRADAVSIRAPRVGSDPGASRTSPSGRRFQSALPVWGATPGVGRHENADWFQSALPVWGATIVAVRLDRKRQSFNPRSPCGERRAIRRLKSCFSMFQSALPVWGATSWNWPFHVSNGFQSALPVWGATTPDRR